MSRTVLIVALCAAAAVALAALTGCVVLRRRIAALRGGDTRVRALGDEASRTRRETSRFVAGVSHELRTPLTAIIGFTELLRDGRAGSVNSHQHEYLEIVRSSAGHLLTLIDDVLDTAGVQSGHVRLAPVPVAPATIAQECVVPLRHLASERGIALDYRPLDRASAVLDPERLRQVIVNLLSNAIKFTGTGGRVTLTVSRRDPRLLITVSDTGIGIAEADQARIFEPFVRVGGSEHPGNGLGLALLQELVHAQGGGIGVQSRLGAGSTFTVWLPWVPAEQTPAPITPELIIAGAGETAVPRATPNPLERAATDQRPRRRRRFRPSDARRGPVATDAASRPASARALRP